LSFAKASTTEEPDEGKLHVRDCAGGAGQPAFLPRRVIEEKKRMGVSVHYRGRLESLDRLPELREKLIGIASNMGWEYQLLDEDWSVPAKAVLEHNEESAEIKGYLGLKGIQLKPPGESESLDFFFNAKGLLLSPMNVILIQEGVLESDDAWISVKTQFLTPEMHVMIIGLLKYIKSTIFPALRSMTKESIGRLEITGN
jgi:hypothetical protein